MKTAVLIIAIVTNQGELEMKASYLEVCPETAPFSETMDKFKSEGKIIEWNAICLHPQVDAKVEGND